MYEEDQCKNMLSQRMQVLAACSKLLAEAQLNAECEERYQDVRRDSAFSRDVQEEEKQAMSRELVNIDTDFILEVTKLVGLIFLLLLIHMQTYPETVFDILFNQLKDKWHTDNVPFQQDNAFKHFVKTTFPEIFGGDSDYTREYSEHNSAKQDEESPPSEEEEQLYGNIFKSYTILFNSTQNAMYAIFMSVAARFFEEHSKATQEDRKISGDELMLSLGEELMDTMMSVSAPEILDRIIAHGSQDKVVGEVLKRLKQAPLDEFDQKKTDIATVVSSVVRASMDCAATAPRRVLEYVRRAPHGTGDNVDHEQPNENEAPTLSLSTEL
ncbi:hypothetical protein CYMTET_35722 [Cymbomonas tetramitiformis]|uniref:Uncharacterized protein n=1 Tax=Cymbomonas tetramitiformis TaxID=36881 RepID=A0AAE0KNU2_9CHLO|nr:hypothetical protein CYMTET_35722 [Cymbomonas tetramitiformis]